ncbi:MAG: hypothetical protein FWC92_11885 [Defluviitaleaceae bacterium]|nr:hypothetical protein [Defluviitaleaceae bacterium]
MKKYRAIVYFAALMFTLALASCGRDSGSVVSEDYANDRAQNVGDAFIPPAVERNDTIINNTANYVIGDFYYPDNPAKQLKIALENNITAHGLPMITGDIERIVFNNREYTQIKVDFTDSGNIGVILFLNRHLDFDLDVLLDERENPSFTVALKDHDNYQDMIMLLTSIIMYLSPQLYFEEAQRLAILQDRTITTDGYSMPLDIGGYQIQARYTNPHVFFRTPYFDAMLGVKVRAITQLWQGAFYTGNFYHITGPHDYHLLDISFWDESRHPEGVFADFIVKNTWQYQCWRHGCTSTIVDVESMTGRRFSLSLDTWTRFLDPYEFGVGQKYTIFIGLRFNQGIVYAIQRSTSTEPNTRGQAQLADMLALEFIDSIRTLPDWDGNVFEVHFHTYAFGHLNIFYVLEGYGLGGETVWPIPQYYPLWDDYTFLGWFDNPYFTGEPYTNKTPIYQDTHLFPNWRYSGPGGIWPRAYRGIIHGLDDENALLAGQTISITVMGYNMGLEFPQDKRFRWMPISWRLSNGANGIFTGEAPFQSDIILDTTGEQWLYITYLEEVFDRTQWQGTEQVREVRERLLIVQ